jgi:lipopolysaccharide/colanic/teichoic acid biosynthesis glycosyltransferase
MQENAEKHLGPTWAKPNDPRTTRVGKIIRPAHLDEIPQFVNVLKGEMSLVGPRPERPEFVSDLNQKIPYYRQRLDCKPGITGLAQVSWRYDATLSDVARKLSYDLYYIRHRSMFFDIMILLSTIRAVVMPHNQVNGSKPTLVTEEALDAHHQTPLPDSQKTVLT